MEQRKPMVGDTIIYWPGQVDKDAQSNGAIVIPGVIVRMWDENSGVSNLKLFPDGTGSLWRTSVQRCDCVVEATLVSPNSACWMYPEEWAEIQSTVEEKMRGEWLIKNPNSIID